MSNEAWKTARLAIVAIVVGYIPLFAGANQIDSEFFSAGKGSALILGSFALWHAVEKRMGYGGSE